MLISGRIFGSDSEKLTAADSFPFCSAFMAILIILTLLFTSFNVSLKKDNVNKFLFTNFRTSSASFSRCYQLTKKKSNRQEVLKHAYSPDLFCRRILFLGNLHRCNHCLGAINQSRQTLASPSKLYSL